MKTRLKELRMMNNYSISELCRKMEMHRSCYRDFENDARRRSVIDILKKLSVIYEVSIDYMLFNENIYDNNSVLEKFNVKMTNDKEFLRRFINYLRNNRELYVDYVMNNE